MKKLDGKRLVRLNRTHLLLWLVPGFIANYFLRNQLWWTNFMSWYAIVITTGTMWAASRTEKKQDEADGKQS